MEEDSEANNNNNGVGNNHPEETQEELREKILAALRLVYTKYDILDEQASIYLNTLTTKSLRPQWINGCESFKIAIKNGLDPALPELGKPIDGFTPPKIPPIKVLEGLIGECGMPFEKQLTDTDKNKGQGRLSIAKDLFGKFVKPLMSDEEPRTQPGNTSGCLLFDGDRVPDEIQDFEFENAVLTSGWNEFHGNNEFKALHDWVTLWVFHHKETAKFCFVMIGRMFPTGKLVAKRSQKKRKTEEVNK